VKFQIEEILYVPCREYGDVVLAQQLFFEYKTLDHHVGHSGDARATIFLSGTDPCPVFTSAP
jgi:hypothetical protein